MILMLNPAMKQLNSGYNNRGTITVIKKYHLIQPKNSLPISSKNPFKRLWTKWAKKGENIRYPPFTCFHHDEK